MKNQTFLNRTFKLIILLLLLNNFSAFAQKTTIWIVKHAEVDTTIKSSDPVLSEAGLQRAIDLEKTLKHQRVEDIYTTGQKCSQQTANPLAGKVKILPRIYTDSVQKLAEIIKRNFAGKNVLVVASYDTILPLLAALGADSPFDALDKEDYDQLFTITIKESGDVSSAVQYYGKKHHVNAIPQSYIMDNFTPMLPNH
jgi:2,3-bisphosphoglycerate-dependent phosphoglycerate mutase